jgi:hypothetical protein
VAYPLVWDVSPYCSDPLKRAIVSKRAKKIDEELALTGKSATASTAAQAASQAAGEASAPAAEAKKDGVAPMEVSEPAAPAAAAGE